MGPPYLPFIWTLPFPGIQNKQEFPNYSLFWGLGYHCCPHCFGCRCCLHCFHSTWPSSLYSSFVAVQPSPHVKALIPVVSAVLQSNADTSCSSSYFQRRNHWYCCFPNYHMTPPPCPPSSISQRQHQLQPAHPLLPPRFPLPPQLLQLSWLAAG
jgi:hypothetical protein